jgi:putative SOS response-associated peptidase YedK
VLQGGGVAAWLDPTLTDPSRVHKLLTNIQLDPLAVRGVSTAVKKVGTDRPDLIEPIDDAAADKPLEFAVA